MLKRNDGFMRVVDLFLIIGVLVLFTLQAPPFLRTTFADRTPPITEFKSVAVLNNPASPGGFLEVRIFREKVRDDCWVESSRHAVGSDGVVFQLQDGEWIGGEADVHFLDFAYPLPERMPLDDYTLHVTLSYFCPRIAEPFVYAQPVVTFRVE